jgi:hypothetical protein
MNAYKTKDFARRARKEKVSDDELRAAIKEIEAGRIDADLGAYLIKQRVSQGKGGRANSHRAIVATKDGDRIVFLHLFAKSDKANLSSTELKVYREIAGIMAGISQAAVDALIRAKEWTRIEDDQEPKGVSD